MDLMGPHGDPIGLPPPAKVILVLGKALFRDPVPRGPGPQGPGPYRGPALWARGPVPGSRSLGARPLWARGPVPGARPYGPGLRPGPMGQALGPALSWP